MASIAVFGGSFSPIHVGHLGVAGAILERGLADEVWLMPCRRNPLKADAPDLSDAERLDLIRKAVSYGEAEGILSAGKVRVSEIELHRPAPSYTIDTMRILEEEHPGSRFRLVMGSDSYLGFDSWKEASRLEKQYCPIVYPRPGFPLHAVKPREDWTLLEGVKLNDVSSTEIRRRLAEGSDCSDVMPWGGVDTKKWI